MNKLPEVDDAFNKLDNDLGSGFRRVKSEVSELYSFRCEKCGYRNVHDCKILTCGCGNNMVGTLVFRKVNGIVIWDSRNKARVRRR